MFLNLSNNKLLTCPDLSNYIKLNIFVIFNNNFTTLHKSIIKCSKLNSYKKYKQYKHLDTLPFILNNSIENYYYSNIMKYYNKIYLTNCK